MKKLNLLLSAIAIVISANAYAQVQMPQPSPTSEIKQNIGLMEAIITYSRPSARDRKIFGDLVQYDELWRTGANASTKLMLNDEANIHGNTIPAGTYALYTLPGKEEWTIILNKNTELWGIDGYDQSEDIARFQIKSKTTDDFIETFTMNFTDLTYNSANVKLAWENTVVHFNIETDVDTKVLASIEKTMSGEPKPADLYQAASYFLSQEKSLGQALNWANTAINIYEKEDRNVFWIYHLKAKIQAAMNLYQDAIETANISIEKAQEANNTDYVRMNKKYIAKWQEKS